MLSLIKENINVLNIFMKKVKLFILVGIFIQILCFPAHSAYDSVEFAFDEDVPDKNQKSVEKIKARLSITENPNKPDFFTRNDLGEAIDLDPVTELDGVWKGVYTVDEKSIKWINPKVSQSQIFNSIEYNDYDINMKFNISPFGRIYSLEIFQDKFSYGHVHFQKLNSKKLI